MADRMPPPGMTLATMAQPSGKSGRMPAPGVDPKADGDGKVSPEDAQVLRSDQHCINCTMYEPLSGECSKVSGHLDPDDGCVQYFEAIGSDEPDDDDAGGASDGDEDDQMGAAA